MPIIPPPEILFANPIPLYIYGIALTVTAVIGIGFYFIAYKIKRVNWLDSSSKNTTSNKQDR